MNPLWYLVPIVVGLAHPIILQMSVRVSRHTGDMESSVILHLVGAIVGSIWFLIGIRGSGYSGLSQIPWWAYLAGAIGVTCLAATNRTLPVVGVATFCALAVASQLVIALFFDRHGLMGASIREIGASHWLGVCCLVVGAFLVSR